MLFDRFWLYFVHLLNVFAYWSTKILLGNIFLPRFSMIARRRLVVVEDRNGIIAIGWNVRDQQKHSETNKYTNKDTL